VSNVTVAATIPDVILPASAMRGRILGIAMRELRSKVPSPQSVFSTHTPTGLGACSMFKVNYSLENDIKNYLNTLWKFSYYKHGRTSLARELKQNFPRKFLRDLKQAKRKDTAYKVIAKYLQIQHPFLHEYITRVERNLQAALNENEAGIVGKIESVYGIKFPFKQIKVHLTTLKICPYNFKEKWFMVSIYGGKNNHLSTALHELNHFVFYRRFAPLRKKLGNEKYESLKEALTVFTNPEEPGYPRERKLRLWLKGQTGTIPEIIASGEWKKFLTKS
jgi:hypothetical protein